MDAVAAGLGADVDDRVAHPASAGVENLFLRSHPQRQGVHQRVARVAGGLAFEVNVAADGGHPDAVAVKGDAADHALGHRAALRVFERPEAQRVQDGQRPGAHGEDVPQDAAHPGGGPLERLDEAGVVVGLDLEDGGQAVADVHHPGVLPRALQHLRAGGGQPLQVHLARLVGAVLAPHHAEDAELGEGGLPAENLLDAVVFLGGQPVLGHQVSGCVRPIHLHFSAVRIVLTIYS